MPVHRARCRRQGRWRRRRSMASSGTGTRRNWPRARDLCRLSAGLVRKMAEPERRFRGGLLAHAGTARRAQSDGRQVRAIRHQPVTSTAADRGRSVSNRSDGAGWLQGRANRVRPRLSLRDLQCGGGPLIQAESALAWRPQARGRQPSVDDLRCGLHPADPVHQTVPLGAAGKRFGGFMQLADPEFEVILNRLPGEVSHMRSESCPKFWHVRHRRSGQ